MYKRQIFVYGGAIFALPGAFSLVTAVRFLNGRKFLFIDCGEMAVTKLDGTAKGGVVIGISDQFKIPVKYIGLGEGCLLYTSQCVKSDRSRVSTHFLLYNRYTYPFTRCV